ncbi:hypothetical protein KAFR_0D01740 [Kazachstania africana CBS 2517]|uniref:LsmAD domain-containing protein n=1 Tax=Kazachstania africana (strain ATCC 22294 / BCRC 22015 / CBS 2517 / CECT 1963 / NBRC 1671 / NRRL Y-8276) TaxID=1071382 RepID=H2ATX1_KAZAF|nr:hypothetical protein KAFR_0D01740 [Kazachstania africana CBS 2517]CCF57821.1 hypothetical protein KAFR_0D01740 [Kazachstania africana CBS 2517]
MKGNFKKQENKRSSVNFSKGNSNNSSGSSTFFESAETSRQFNDRLEYLLANSIGKVIVATVNSGVQYQGILNACNLESTSGIDLVLGNPVKIPAQSGAEDGLKAELENTLLIRGDDVAEIELKEIDLSLDETITSQNKSTEPEAVSLPTPAPESSTEEKEITPSAFKTDVDISGASKTIKERELQRWMPETTSDIGTAQNQTLEESSSTWDQFAVNEEKFGVKSTFDEHFYTTKINREDPNYARKVKEAERLAKEIEQQGSSGNIHLAEDRGIIIDGSGMDEEDLYSGVDRRGDELLASLKSNAKPSSPMKANKYVPPALRNQPHHMDPAIISSSAAKNMPASTGAGIRGSAQAKIVNKEELKKSEPLERSEEVKESVDSKQSEDVTDDKEGVKPELSAKEAQIEELKKFSQKFKVPYDVPSDMKNVLKKPQQQSSSVNQKPKPSSKNVKTTSSPSAMQAKIDTKRGSSSSQSGHTPVHSPQTSRASAYSRRRTPGSFFGSKKPQSGVNKKELFVKKFNFFLSSKEAHEEKQMEPFLIEKPYFATPTWTGTVEESYKTLFPDARTAIQQAQERLHQRQMHAMGVGNPIFGAGAPGVPGMNVGISAGGMGMMGLPMGPGGAAAGPNPMVNSFGNVYMPFQPQPMFYPGMAPMMPMMTDENNTNVSPQAASPDLPPAYINAGAPPFGYPGAIPPFQGMMNNNMPGASGYKQSYHGGHNSSHHHSHRQHGHRNNNSSNRNQ